MLRTLASTRILYTASHPSKSNASNFPTHARIQVQAASPSDVPTHMLALYSTSPQQPAENQSGKTQVQLIPIHALVLAAFCANVPSLGQFGLPEGVEENVEVFGSNANAWTRTTIPVVPMGVPAPDVAGLLTAFLYTRDERQLVKALIGIDVASPPSYSYSPSTSPLESNTYTDPIYDDEPSIHDSILHTSLLLSHTTSLAALTHRAKLVAAFWRNACALGVVAESSGEGESGVWRCGEVAWAVVVGAVAVAGGKD